MSGLIDQRSAVERDDVIWSLRRNLRSQGFVEVQTPVLIRGGVSPIGATPQRIEVSLRDCMELRLRSVLASGLNRAYEIGPCFRLKDVDDLRAPEFYMMELFAANLNYSELVSLSKGLLAATGTEIQQWRELSVATWIEQTTGVDLTREHSDIRKALVDSKHVDSAFLSLPAYRAVNELIAQKLEVSLSGWTFLKDFPKCTVCLARRQPAASHLIERFEIFWNDVEVAHGFVDELEASDVESRMRENGPEFFDPYFLALLREGCLPQSSGVGIGIERLLMARHRVRSIRRWIHDPQF
jgi:lysyl-tRNA synthetase class II